MSNATKKKSAILKATASEIYLDLANEVMDEIKALTLDDRELDVALKEVVQKFQAGENTVDQDNNINRYIVNCGYLLEIQELVAYIDSPNPDKSLVNTIIDTIGALLV